MIKPTNPMNRRGGASRGLVLLLLIAGLSVAAWWLARERQTVDLTLGGALFPVAADEVEGLLLTKGGQQYRFDRLPDGGWSLSGAANDYLDEQAMTALVGILPTAMGGAILPGTEPEDRRYEFNGPDAIRLRILLANGGDIALALGTINPVTGNYFASGAGRAACFPVAGPFRDKLFMLPTTVQAKKLLPAFERDRVQRLLLTRSGQNYEFRREGDRWWLKLPTTTQPEAWRGLPRLIVDYQTRYADRRRQDESGLWLLASRQAMGQMIYEVSETVVRDIKPAAEAASRIRQWDLDPPWRQVVLQGPGLNSDPAAPVLDQYTIAFGPPVADDQVPALRRGNVLLTDNSAINLLDQGLEALLEQNALSENALRADSLTVFRGGSRVLAAARTGEALTEEGRAAWRTGFPGPKTPNLDETARHGLSQDLLVNLNRAKILAVLPATDDAAVLQATERVRIRLGWQTPRPRELVLEMGYLDLEKTAPVAREMLDRRDAGRPAAIWFPATGKLLQIPDQLLVSARTMARYVESR